MEKKRGWPPGIHMPIKHFSEEKRQLAIKKSKSKWNMKTPWNCEDCNRSYSIAGKHNHLKTQKRQSNINIITNKIDVFEKLETASEQLINDIATWLSEGSVDAHYINIVKYTCH